MYICITIETFESADEVFLTSSSGGVTPTTKFSSITKTLIDEYIKKKNLYSIEL